MTGLRSAVRLPALPGTGDGVLSMRVTPYLHGEKLTRQRVFILVNDHFADEFEVFRECVLDCILPAARLHAVGANLVQLVHPDAIQPVRLDPSADDHRRLALSVKWMTLERW